MAVGKMNFLLFLVGVNFFFSFVYVNKKNLDRNGDLKVDFTINY